MARKSQDFPTRIAAIAGAIVVLLGLLVWLLSGLGTPTPPAQSPETEAEEAPASASPATPIEAPPVPPPGAPGTEDTQLVDVDDGSLTLQLYLSDGRARELVPRIRRIDAPFDLPAQAQMALDALIAAGEPGYASPLPAETVVREVWVDEASGTAYVDLARNFPEVLGGGSLAEIHAVYAIVGTLTGTFPEILQVQLLVGGRPVDTINGHLDVSGPLVPLDDWLY